MNERTSDIEQLSARLDGALPADADAILSARLENDEALAAIESDLALADHAFLRAARDELEEPIPLNAAATIRNGFAARRRQASRSRWLGAALPIAASLLIVAMGGFWLESRIAQQTAERHREIAWLVDTAVQNALETAVSGSEVSFGGPDSPTDIRVTPIRTYRSTSNHWCREFEERVTIGGRIEFRTAVACRDTDGTWRRTQSTTTDQTI